MKTLLRSGFVCLLLATASLTARAEPSILATQLRRAEQLGWFDPDAALALLDTLQSQVQGEQTEVEALTLRGFADVDSRRDHEAQQTIDRLQALANQGLVAADLSRHLVRAYLLRQSDRYEDARAELDSIDPTSVQTDLDRYRLEYLRGCVLRFLGQHEVALLSFEHALDIANAMHSVPYTIHTMLTSSQFLLRIGNLDRASAQLKEAKRLAQQTSDEASLVTILEHESDIAGRRGDHAAELSEILEALTHAQNVGSPQLLATTYCDLADAYLNERNYATSLAYSKKALALAPKVRRNGFEQTLRFNIGIAEIGVGHVAEGKRTVEREIQAALDAGNVVDAEDSLGEYAAALETARDWHAVDVLRRDAQLRDQLMTNARQQALLELSAKFDAERRARQIDLLTRDNAIKSAALGSQRLRQELVLTVALLALTLSAIVGWAFRGVRKANRQLRYSSEHDLLTGLPNRRYFHEHVLTQGDASRFEGCVLIIDIDHFKRINDLFGHQAGDHVLACVGKRLAAALRETDTLLRWGGEEFLAVLPPISDAALAITAHRLLHAVSGDLLSWHGEMIHCTTSIGYASFPLPGMTTSISLDRAISLADKALYQAKRRGRNRACRISELCADSEAELAWINTEFEAAAAAERVQLNEITGLVQ
jgi:diguanylate cyclase (GGDEF)-like protein